MRINKEQRIKVQEQEQEQEQKIKTKEIPDMTTSMTLPDMSLKGLKR
jgi:hypothetical protein